MNKYIVLFLVMNALIVASGMVAGYNMVRQNYIGMVIGIIAAGVLISIKDSVFYTPKTKEQIEGRV